MANVCYRLRYGCGLNPSILRMFWGVIKDLICKCFRKAVCFITNMGGFLPNRKLWSVLVELVMCAKPFVPLADVKK